MFLSSLNVTSKALNKTLTQNQTKDVLNNLTIIDLTTITPINDKIQMLGVNSQINQTHLKNSSIELKNKNLELPVLLNKTLIDNDQQTISEILTQNQTTLLTTTANSISKNKFANITLLLPFSSIITKMPNVVSKNVTSFSSLNINHAPINLTDTPQQTIKLDKNNTVNNKRPVENLVTKINEIIKNNNTLLKQNNSAVNSKNATKEVNSAVFMTFSHLFLAVSISFITIFNFICL